MPFRLRTAAAGAVLAAAVVLPCPAVAAARPPTAAAGPSTTAAPGWSAAPTGTARTSFYLEGPAGSALTDRLAVRNPSDRPLTVRLAGDGDGGDGQRAGAWLAFGAAQVTVPPRTQASVPFTAAVPRTAAPGSHPAALTVTGPGARIRIPVRLRVTGPTLSALTVEHVAVTRRGSAAVIRYTLVNRGNTALRPQVTVRADGLFGTLLSRPARPLPDVLPPGARTARTETWSDPPALDAVDVTLTATAAGGAQDTGTAAYTAVPWGTGVAAALLLAAGGGAWAIRRRRGRSGRAAPTGDGGAGPGPDDGGGPPPHRPGTRATAGTRPANGTGTRGAAATTTTGTTSSTTTVAKTGSGVRG
ncbi:hypothetical protein [Streptomyces noursei]|uniref:hypothetical protein n=1 Tax=Streptomyces noursei TaxID=1971 RepID=UPI0023B7A33D|nr:hypothetical protein [Streptomyces noursei]